MEMELPAELELVGGGGGRRRTEHQKQGNWALRKIIERQEICKGKVIIKIYHR